MFSCGHQAPSFPSENASSVANAALFLIHHRSALSVVGTFLAPYWHGFAGIAASYTWPACCLVCVTQSAPGVWGPDLNADHSAPAPQDAASHPTCGEGAGDKTQGVMLDDLGGAGSPSVSGCADYSIMDTPLNNSYAKSYPDTDSITSEITLYNVLIMTKPPKLQQWSNGKID